MTELSRVTDLVERSPRRAAAVAGGLAGLSGWWAGGPVAAVGLACYATVAATAVCRRHRGRAERRRSTHLRDLADSAAAELRAGLPPATVLDGLTEHPTGERATRFRAAEVLRGRVAAAVRISERTGAPLADLLERIAAHTRAADRAAAAAAAHAAGARATAWMLAGLPVAGIGLGYAIGVAPLPVLLHTPVGAASAFGALALQLTGVAWAGRIVRAAGERQR